MANELIISGRIDSVLPLQQGTSKAGKPWQKQSYVLDTGGQYPRKYNPQNEACGTSQTKRTPTHPAEKKRSVTFSGNIPRAFGNHPNALLASVK